MGGGAFETGGRWQGAGGVSACECSCVGDMGWVSANAGREGYPLCCRSVRAWLRLCRRPHAMAPGAPHSLLHLPLDLRGSSNRHNMQGQHQDFRERPWMAWRGDDIQKLSGQP